MNAQLESLLKEFAERVATRSELSGLNLPESVRPSVRLQTQRVARHQLRPGESRIGGLPDVPRGLEWPRWLPSKPRDDKYGQAWRPKQPAPLRFIAQLDLQAIPRIDEALPSSGWLYFFYDRYCEPWGYDPADRRCCQLAANGIYCGDPEGYQSAAAAALAGGAVDWCLLLQIDTDEEGPGWMWCDVGRIYYWIRRQDLASLRFEDAWLILQSC